jgi:periplasmic protein TonB
MIFGQKNLFDFPGNSLGKKATHIILAPTVKKDISLEALLEEPIEKKPPRNPLEWIGASAIHLLILVALIIIPLYTTGTIHLGEYRDIPLVAPPPPPPPAAVAAAAPAVSRAPLPHAVVLRTHKLVAPISIPKKIPQEQADGAAPNLGGVIGGVPGGVAGGQPGGAENGVLGAAGNAPPPPPPVAKPVQQKRIVRVGSNLQPPRQKFSVNPEYPPLARQAHIAGVVIVDAIIDEHGNVVQAHALSGPPLLIPPALKAVLQWKYEPTVLNGQPVSVELEVQVNFARKG